MKLKYIKLFENFDSDFILSAPADVVFSKESFDYLCSCLNHLGRSCAGESKYLPTKQPIKDLVEVIYEWGDELGFEVDRTNQSDNDVRTSMEDAFKYLKAMNNFLNFKKLQDNRTRPAVGFGEQNKYRPSRSLEIELGEGYELVENVLSEFRIFWAGKVGKAPNIFDRGNVRRDSRIPHWTDND